MKGDRVFLETSLPGHVEKGRTPMIGCHSRQRKRRTFFARGVMKFLKGGAGSRTHNRLC